ncbi:hypothetical protein [Candidatus Palauibacter sp.]|uniref:hypothetical protein n=1 Tax=Candidatus Palauibacter sp. TaxID=3101350 RepID=UPI003B517DBC
MIDASPVRRSPGGGAARLLQTVRRHPGPFAARLDAVAAVEAEGFAAYVAHWLATNLVLGDGGYSWPSEIHVVRADQSDVLLAGDMKRLRAARLNGRVHIHQLRGGHWLHVDNPGGLVKLVRDHLG